MSELVRDGLDYKGWLTGLGVDADLLAGRAFDSIRNERAFGFPNAPDHVMAAEGWCMSVTPFIARELQHSPGLLSHGLSVRAESHMIALSEASANKLITIGQTVVHWYPVIYSDASDYPSPDDIVVEASFKRRMQPENRKKYPDVFVGPRFVIASMMLVDGLVPQMSEIYTAESYDPNSSVRQSVEWKLKYSISQ